METSVSLIGPASKRLWKVLLVGLGAALLGAGSAFSAQFHVTTTGSSGGSGSSSSPWDLATALNQPSAVHAGDTIWVHGGNYASANGYTSRLTGTSSRPIIVRNWNNERATLISTPVINVAQDKFPLLVSGSFTWYWGLEFTENTTSPLNFPGAAGVNILGDSNKMINCVSHDNLGAGFVDQNSANTELYGNIAFYNGRRENSPNHDTHDYGVYAQSSNGYGHKYYTDNLFLNNYGNYQIHIYTEEGIIDSFRIAHNTVWSYPSQSMIMVNGGVDNWIDSNYVYGTESNPSYPYTFNTWWERRAPQGMRVRGNYFMKGRDCFTSGGDRMFTGNFCYGETPRVDDNPTSPSQIPNSDGSNLGSTNTWLTASYGQTPPSPTGVSTFVRKNKYEPKRANVTVFNWNGNSSISVDLSAVLAVGDTFAVKDAQNFYGASVVSGVYAGGTVNLPLTVTAVAAPFTVPSDLVTPLHSSSKFATFVVLGPAYTQSQPAAPTGSLTVSPLTLPAGGGTVTLSWTSQNAASASIDQGIGSVPTNGSRSVQVGGTTTFTLTLTGAGGSATSRATVQVDGPLAPALLAPACALVNVATPVTLSWNSVSGATAYEVVVATDSLFSAPVYSNTSVSTTSQQVPGLASGTEYYWRVRGKNASGNGSYCSAWWFTTAAGQSQPGLPLALLGTPPEQGTVTINVQKTDGPQTANLTMCIFDADGANEGVLYINGRDSVLLFGSIANPSRDNCATVFTIATPASDWVDGANTLRFAHTQTGGYRVDSISVSFGAPLPIQLSRFVAAMAAPGNVALTWTTLSETNNYGFYVQKSPGVSSPFVRIDGSFVPGHGTTIDEHLYSYTDNAFSPAASYYRLEQVDLDGTSHFSDPVQPSGLTGVEGKALPTAFALHQNYPNPFNPSTTIEFDMPHSGFTTLKVYNALGAEVATLLSGSLAQGSYNVRWAASGVPSGIYFCRMESGSFVAVRKMMVLK